MTERSGRFSFNATSTQFGSSVRGSSVVDPTERGRAHKKTGRLPSVNMLVASELKPLEEQNTRDASDPIDEAESDFNRAALKIADLPMQYGINEAFMGELRRCSAYASQQMLEMSSTVGRTSQLLSETEAARLPVDTDTNTQNRCVRRWHQFTRVRPLHVCTAHSFVCFRENGDLVAVTPTCVLIYDRPPAACELNYKEPLYSIPVTNVTRVADLNDTSILMLRQGSFQFSEERASDEVLIAEVATNAVHVLAKIALPQTVILNNCYPYIFQVLREQPSQRDSAECRGMQVNKLEHKVYLLYNYHLAVIDLDMRLEPVVVQLRCRSEQTGPAVALLEFDHAVYILTAKSWLLASNKTDLFTQDPSSCCMSVLKKMDSRLAAQEIRSYVVDRRHCTAFFSVPKGRKIVSIQCPVSAGCGPDCLAARYPLLDCLVLQDRLYSAASSRDWSAAVPSALAWDATTEQLLVLEWGAENNGVLVSVDFFTEEGSFNVMGVSLIGLNVQPVCDRFPIVKTFCRTIDALSELNS